MCLEILFLPAVAGCTCDPTIPQGIPCDELSFLFWSRRLGNAGFCPAVKYRAQASIEAGTPRQIRRCCCKVVCLTRCILNNYDSRPEQAPDWHTFGFGNSSSSMQLIAAMLIEFARDLKSCESTTTPRPRRTQTRRHLKTNVSPRTREFLCCGEGPVLLGSAIAWQCHRTEVAQSMLPVTYPHDVLLECTFHCARNRSRLRFRLVQPIRGWRDASRRHKQKVACLHGWWLVGARMGRHLHLGAH